jgi:hypothetical protein
MIVRLRMGGGRWTWGGPSSERLLNQLEVIDTASDLLPRLFVVVVITPETTPTRTTVLNYVIPISNTSSPTTITKIHNLHMSVNISELISF